MRDLNQVMVVSEIIYRIKELAAKQINEKLAFMVFGLFVLVITSVIEQWSTGLSFYMGLALFVMAVMAFEEISFKDIADHLARKDVQKGLVMFLLAYPAFAAVFVMLVAFEYWWVIPVGLIVCMVISIIVTSVVDRGPIWDLANNWGFTVFMSSIISVISVAATFSAIVLFDDGGFENKVVILGTIVWGIITVSLVFLAIWSIAKLASDISKCIDNNYRFDS